MTDNKKAAGVGKPQAALHQIQHVDFTPFPRRIKVSAYRLAPWLFFVGVLHG